MAAEIGSSDAPLKRGKPGLDDAVPPGSVPLRVLPGRAAARAHVPGRASRSAGTSCRKTRWCGSAPTSRCSFPPSEIYERRCRRRRPESEGRRLDVGHVHGAGRRDGRAADATTRRCCSDPAYRHQTAALARLPRHLQPPAASRCSIGRGRSTASRSPTNAATTTCSRSTCYSLIGMGTSGLQTQLGISDQILLYYAGLLSQRPRAAAALEGILQDYFGVPVEVEQFTGEWFLMNVDALTSLGAGGPEQSAWRRTRRCGSGSGIRRRGSASSSGRSPTQQFQDFLPTSDALPPPRGADAILRRRGVQLRGPADPAGRRSAVVRARRRASRRGSAGRCGSRPNRSRRTTTQPVLRGARGDAGGAGSLRLYPTTCATSSR